MNLFFTNVAYADGVDDFIHKVNGVILNPVIKILFAVALIYFLWGVTQMILNAESEEGRTTGKQHILWGVIGMTIMFSVWGIINLIINTTGVKGINPKQGTVNLPKYDPKLPGVGAGSTTQIITAPTSTSSTSTGGTTPTQINTFPIN